ncbi:369_t:CDS:2 [Cetraspora pellucida]|uniref:369_t:CDS:1 n=1 Tax=Cetraspora pellucida TaxID=1433469 RepID=A0A9N9NXH3_9GLOM|nr:369_t:CDS:2 [Cetraspora pellucida]
MLKTKAFSIYEKLKNSGIEFPTTFEASNGWTISEESESADKAAIESLYFCLGPNKTLASKSDTAKGYKKDKSCLTILLCYNASGTQKFKLFVIGKSAYPKLHIQVLIANIKLEFLPSNTTSIDEIESGKSIEPINIKEAIYMISDAWKQVLLSTIVHYWKKTKIFPLEINLTTDTSNNNDINELEQLLEELEMSYDYIKLSAEEYVEVDKHLQIIDIPTEESIVQNILKEQGLINDEDSNNEADNEEEEKIIDDLVLYNKEKKALVVAKKYLKQSQFATKNNIYLLQQIIKKAESFYQSKLK